MKSKNIATKLGTFLGAMTLVGASLVAQAGVERAQIGVEREGNQLDFASLKAKCLELNSNQQLKPFKAIVTCRDVKYVWRESKERQKQPLPNQREIGSSIRMKGFETPYQEERVPVEDSEAACVLMDKWKISVPSVDAELSCDDLNAIDNLTTYCLEQITTRTSEDPSLVVEEATGEQFNTCGKQVERHQEQN